MTNVVPVPNSATTAQVFARAHEGAAARAGDLIVLCVNATMDLWVAWPIAAVDEAGRAMTVRDKTGGEWPVVALMAQDRCMIAPASAFEAASFAGLHWRTFRGLQAASDAFQGCFLSSGGRR
jgi:hypothetical protein